MSEEIRKALGADEALPINAETVFMLCQERANLRRELAEREKEKDEALGEAFSLETTVGEMANQIKTLESRAEQAESALAKAHEERDNAMKQLSWTNAALERLRMEKEADLAEARRQ